jgi:DNA-binding transcriptional regulator GbsR (MarR family)
MFRKDKSPKEEFIDLVTEINKAKGLDELSSKLVSILFIEPKEVSLEELAEKSGYSLSAVSTSMKIFENTGFVKRLKKPKSRKVYFYMGKDMHNQFIQTLKKIYNVALVPMKEKLPNIIIRYKKEKGNKDELKIIENHYQQVLQFEKLMKRFIENANTASS